MRKIFALMILIFMLNNVSAFEMTIYVRDYNTRGGIGGANISIRQPTKTPPVDALIYTTTNDLGFKTVYDVNYEHYINVSATGYFPDLDSTYHNITNDSVMYFYLRPISTTGLVKVMWTDDTVNMPSRRLCFFYAENGRLADCVGKNETFWGINNHAYTVEPETNFYDFFTSTKSLWVNRLNIIPYLGITLFIIFILVKVIKKR